MSAAMLITRSVYGVLAATFMLNESSAETKPRVPYILMKIVTNKSGHKLYKRLLRDRYWGNKTSRIV